MKGRKLRIFITIQGRVCSIFLFTKYLYLLKSLQFVNYLDEFYTNSNKIVYHTEEENNLAPETK